MPNEQIDFINSYKDLFIKIYWVRTLHEKRTVIFGDFCMQVGVLSEPKMDTYLAACLRVETSVKIATVLTSSVAVGQ